MRQEPDCATSWLASSGDMAARIRRHDWAATPLGPIERWSAALRVLLGSVLNSPLPMVLGWGGDLVTLYNDAYRPLLRDKPDALGRPFLDVWDEARPTIAPVIQRVLDGEAHRFADARFHLLRGGAWEEAFFDYTMSPARDDCGDIVGILHVAVETTAKHRAEAGLRKREAAVREQIEQQLRASEERLRAYAEASSEVLFRMSPDWSVTREVSGFAADDVDLRRRAMTEIIPPEDQARVRAVIDEGVRTKSAVELEHRVIRVTGGIGWFLSRAVPILDPEGELIEWFGTSSDISERKRTEEALRHSEERFRHFGDAAQDVLWIRDCETMQWQYLTAAFETIFGLTVAEGLAGDNYRSWLDLIVPEDRASAVVNIERVRSGEHVTFEYRFRRPSDGAIRWLRDTVFSIPDERGRITLIGGIGEDITDEKMRQEQLARSEERLRSAAEVGRLGLWDWNLVTGDLHWSDEHFRMEGHVAGAITPTFDIWLAGLHPDDRARTEAALLAARMNRTEYVHEFRTLHPDGSAHWLNARGRFFYDAGGRAIRMVGAMTDTTERREWEERQRVLVAELQHRTRNLIAVIRAMAERTMRRAADLPAFRAAFRDRLEALARVQGLLSRLEEHDRVTFDELLRVELAAHGALDGSGDRVSLTGPEGVMLRSSMVQTLAMALHELATNAAKYGALGQPQAHLDVTWALDGEGDADQPWLTIDWRESDVVMAAEGAAPRGTGQGRELIERALPYQLGAQTAYRLGADGVHCTIAVPVSVRNLGTEDGGD